MASRYVRSLFWLCGLTGLGYALMVISTPSESDIEKLKKVLPGIEKNPNQVIQTNQQFTNALQAAVDSNKPLYHMTKQEIEKLVKGQ